MGAETERAPTDADTPPALTHHLVGTVPGTGVPVPLWIVCVAYAARAPEPASLAVRTRGKGMPLEGGPRVGPDGTAAGCRKRCGMRSPGVHLREITDDNRDAVRALRVRQDQKQFVASVSKSLKEAAKTPEANPWYRAVYRGDEPVGFVMLSWKPPTGPFKGRHFLWRLLIDKRYQKRGIGREALAQVIELVRADGATELLTSYSPGDGEPWPFYQKLGFEPTGEIDDGEIVLRLALPAR